MMRMPQLNSKLQFQSKCAYVHIVVWLITAYLFIYVFKIVFEGVRGISYLGDIAIDDVAVRNGFCPPLKQCTFEDAGMCGWRNEKRYALDREPGLSFLKWMEHILGKS